MIFQSVLKVYWITENGQNMAKIEKIGNIQMVDNKEDKFFYFPMISMACTGSGYEEWGCVKTLAQPLLYFTVLLYFLLAMLDQRKNLRAFVFMDQRKNLRDFHFMHII